MAEGGRGIRGKDWMVGGIHYLAGLDSGLSCRTESCDGPTDSSILVALFVETGDVGATRYLTGPYLLCFKLRVVSTHLLLLVRVVF
jgi:hypothetical protein